MLTILHEVGKRGLSGSIVWMCKCDCGNIKPILGRSIRSGATVSCGCYNLNSLSSRVSTHGESKNRKKTAEYNCWISIKDRCCNTKTKAYKDYGGRGIIICEKWRYSFDDFLEDMGRKPTIRHSIDRIDVNGNYEPSNCRWATAQEQSKNKRTTVLHDHIGLSLMKSEWAKLLNISATLISKHMNEGKSIEWVYNFYTKKV